MKKIILVLFLVCSLLACSKKKEDDPTPPVVDPDPPVVQDTERKLTCELVGAGGDAAYFYAPTDTGELSRIVMLYVDTLEELGLTADEYDARKDEMISLMNSTYESGVTYETSRNGEYVTQQFTLVISEMDEASLAAFSIHDIPSDLDDVYDYFGPGDDANCYFGN